MIYYISDNHWSHANIIKYCKRPFNDVEEMNSEMIRRWNETVTPEDTVYYLGDFALGKGEDIVPLVASLNGQKHLIYGNHDEGSLSKHRQAEWLTIQPELYADDNGRVVWMSHYPLYKNPIPDKRNLVRPKASRNWHISLCGHCHNEWQISDAGCINVGADNWDFTPQTLDQLIEKNNWSTDKYK